MHDLCKMLGGRMVTAFLKKLFVLDLLLQTSNSGYLCMNYSKIGVAFTISSAWISVNPSATNASNFALRALA